VNTAELEDLESLPRVGPAIARGIVEGRPYGGTGDLLRVKGIGPKILEGLRSRVTTEPPIIGADR
jgi:competence protein ComEA